MRLIDSRRRRGRPGRVVPQPNRVPAEVVVVTYGHTGGEDPRCHERATRHVIAQRLARLKGCDYAGDYDPDAHYGSAVYFVPGDTVIGIDAARTLGIHGEADLFGGVVPLPFMATKSITHPLVEAGACQPPGWSRAFPRTVHAAVLPGVSAFSAHDARRGGRRLLEQGPVRVKRALGVGGRGQTLVADADALDAAVAALDPAELACYGVALEQHVTDATTYSVGQVRVGGFVATYFGTQKLTRNNSGASVYGGSDLTVARGGFEALLALDVDEGARCAIAQARVYDAAAERCFQGFAASRRNYDIVRGRSPRGEMVSGVLEQSWRIGGASGAEIAALEAFSEDATLNTVHAACSEIYGENAAPPPPEATIYFRGLDPAVGYMTKYTIQAPYADA